MKRGAAAPRRRSAPAPGEAARASGGPGDDYLLGTRDDEIERLGLQHRVWRPQVLACWRRAGPLVLEIVARKVGQAARRVG